MTITFLASSSEANCAVVSQEGQQIIVDAGLPIGEVIGRSVKAGLDPCAWRGVIVSHDDEDHSRHAASLSKRLAIPVYCSVQTLEQERSLERKSYEIRTISDGSAFSIAGLKVMPIATPHCPGSMGFLFCSPTRRASLFTDLSSLTTKIKDALSVSHFIGIESNYSELMLEQCDYVQVLKDRIKSERGHLSNTRLGDFLSNGFEGRWLNTLVLLHLSRKSNLPLIAEAVARKSLEKVNSGREQAVKVLVAPANETLGPLEV